MSSIVRNKIVLVLWRPGEWKTFFASFLASHYPRIFSNIDIKWYNKSIIEKNIKNIGDIENIRYDNRKGVSLLDEWWVNINARRSQSDENRAFGELWMLSRKKNIDIIVCAQLGRMIDVYFRELANYVFEMHAWFEKKDYLMFEANIYTYIDWNKIFIKSIRIDLFQWTQLTNITYNTLEESRINMKKSENWIILPEESILL